MSESRVRKPKALVEAEKKIAELEARIKAETTTKDLWYKDRMELQATVEGLHEVLDDLGIKGYKGEDKYQRLPLSVRLFSWAMKLAQSGKLHE